MVITCRNNKDLCRMLLTQRGRQPKLRFCLKMEVCYNIFLSFRINYTGSSVPANGYQDRMVCSFEVPPGLPKKSISIRLTPLDEVQIRGGNKEDGTCISYDWQLPRDMYFDKANFSHKFYDKYLIVVITDIEPKPTLILKKASS